MSYSLFAHQFINCHRLFTNSTSQGLEPSVASPQTLGLLGGVHAEGEAGAVAKRFHQGPATTTVRSRRLVHVL